MSDNEMRTMDEGFGADGGAGDGADGAEGGEFAAPAERPGANRSTLLLGGLLLIGACAVYFLYIKGGPSSAEAAGDDAATASATISQFLSAGGENIKLMETMLRGTEKVVRQFQAYPSAAQVPLAELRTNPFRHEAPAATEAVTAAIGEEASRRQRAEEREAVLKAVQGLALQSILHGGDRSACMINNTLYGEGEAVGSFTIERISGDAVVVKSGSYRFELRMGRQ